MVGPSLGADHEDEDEDVDGGLSMEEADHEDEDEDEDVDVGLVGLISGGISNVHKKMVYFSPKIKTL